VSGSHPACLVVVHIHTECKDIGVVEKLSLNEALERENLKLSGSE